ncbi:STAS domain-containing protein [Mangrovicella endophytica]|uniref:STAS domain-containing protein n=1 Tax=Mangrovicella endophytica TaxID=2066697 RepID=UPI000C9DF6C8|nr:STAS domain-containing protein [Mangrovicella endophytica]
MARKKTAAASAASLELPAVLDLKAAAPLAEQLLAMRGSPITVSAAQVERIGAQCAQVLLSAAATWKSDKASFAITGASDGFESGLRLMGLSTERLMEQEIAQ